MAKCRPMIPEGFGHCIRYMPISDLPVAVIIGRRYGHIAARWSVPHFLLGRQKPDQRKAFGLRVRLRGFRRREAPSSTFAIYLVAILFIIFDLEIAFLFPVGHHRSGRSGGWSGSVSMIDLSRRIDRRDSSTNGRRARWNGNERSRWDQSLSEMAVWDRSVGGGKWPGTANVCRQGPFQDAGRSRASRRSRSSDKGFVVAKCRKPGRELGPHRFACGL